jgi:hypothetical protein
VDDCDLGGGVFYHHVLFLFSRRGADYSVGREVTAGSKLLTAKFAKEAREGR